MYREYTIYTLHTQYATYAFLIYSLYIVHTYSQLYFDTYKMCVQNKCALCTLYTIVCTYDVQHTHCVCRDIIRNKPFIYFLVTLQLCIHPRRTSAFGAH